MSIKLLPPPQLSPSKVIATGQKHTLSPLQKTPIGRLVSQPLFHPSPVTPTFRTSLTPQANEERRGAKIIAPRVFGGVYDACNSAGCLDENPPEPLPTTAPPPSEPLPEIHHSVPTEEEQRYCALGFSLPEAKHIVQCLDVPGIAQQIPNARIGITPNEIKAFRAVGLIGHEMLICKNWGLSPTEYKEFRKNDIRIVRNTAPQGRYPGLTTPFEQGGLNSVYKIGIHYFQDGLPTIALGKKMLNEAQGWVSSRIGINKNQPRYLCRNVLAYLMSKLFWPVIPRTEPVFINGSLGIVMEKAPGTSPTRTYDYPLTQAPELSYYREEVQKYCRERSKSMEDLLLNLRTDMKVSKDLASFLKVRSVEEKGGQIIMQGVRAAIGGIPFDNPDLHLELQKLQILDAIMGEGDRHSGNYFIYVHPETSTISVMGIDNEQCAGSLTTDPEMLVRGPESDREHEGYRGLKLPLYIHEEIAQKIATVADQQIIETATNLLHVEEIEAMIARMARIRSHIQTRGVVNARLWPTKVREMLANPEIYKNHSYAVRDATAYSSCQAKGQPTKLYREVVSGQLEDAPKR